MDTRLGPIASSPNGPCPLPLVYVIVYFAASLAITAGPHQDVDRETSHNSVLLLSHCQTPSRSFGSEFVLPEVL